MASNQSQCVGERRDQKENAGGTAAYAHPYLRCSARPPRWSWHINRNLATMEFDDRGVFAPEAVDTDRAWLAVHIRSVLYFVRCLYILATTRTAAFRGGCTNCRGASRMKK